MRRHVDYLLDADLNELSIELLISSMQRPLEFIRIKKIKELGIKFPQNYRFLEVLEKNNEDIIQKNFASKFHINQSTVTRSLNALENDGFIKRSILDNNKKNKVIKLTDKGKDVLTEMHKFDAELEKELFRNFSQEEIDEFKKFCVKFSKNAVDFLDF